MHRPERKQYKIHIGSSIYIVILKMRDGLAVGWNKKIVSGNRLTVTAAKSRKRSIYLTITLFSMVTYRKK